MPGAWTQGYWISCNLPSAIVLSFEIPTSGATIWPWMSVDNTCRFDVIKAQLDTNWVYVEWTDPSKQITRIVSLKRY